ncbi:MAG: VanZ family protein [Magnetococcales bacterium]|nr:VanZ family protein [Magnetococcales bacterium]MBF0149777.1 VanZ family protein [Magnetococcales bacterium]MBF0173095.1 VanZ family protein [Magnetococcales bacterium]MBF0347221.1 VanZ family protein [Magnetococcales bacterium]MBF0630176.1 VanZ family protein [Magnetococcales bacterium]
MKMIQKIKNFPAIVRQSPWGWTWVGLYLTLHYSLVPLIPTVEMWLYEVMNGVEHVERIVNAVLAVVLAGVVGLVLLRAKRRIMALAFLGIAALTALTITTNPDERVHFVQYAILAMLIHHAHPARDRQGLIDIMTLVMFAGLADEILQFLLPDRYFDLRDAFMDTMGGAVGLGLILAFKPIPTRPGDPGTPGTDAV